MLFAFFAIIGERKGQVTVYDYWINKEHIQNALDFLEKNTDYTIEDFIGHSGNFSGIFDMDPVTGDF